MFVKSGIVELSWLRKSEVVEFDDSTICDLGKKSLKTKKHAIRPMETFNCASCDGYEFMELRMDIPNWERIMQRASLA